MGLPADPTETAGESQGWEASDEDVQNWLYCQLSFPVYIDTHRDTDTDIELYKHVF